MRLQLLAFLLISILGTLSLVGTPAYAKDDEKVNDKNKLNELKLEGMIQKFKKTYFLKMGEELIKLPSDKSNALTVKVSDFEDKAVILSAEGVVRFSKTGVKSHIVKRINEIKLAAPEEKKDEKKEEKKEEPKK